MVEARSGGRGTRIAGSGDRLRRDWSDCGRDASTANEHRLQRCSFFAQHDNSFESDIEHSSDIEEEIPIGFRPEVN
jgi:hypothetical protein